MIVVSAGHVSQPKSLGAMLRQRWEDLRASVAAEIKRREEGGIPLDDLKPLPEYKGDVDLDGVRVRLRSLSQAEVAEAEICASEAGGLDDGSKDGKLAADRAAREAMRAFIRKAVVDVGGLRDVDGVDMAPRGVSDEDLALYEDNRLLEPLYRAAMSYQLLSASEKKVFGFSEAST